MIINSLEGGGAEILNLKIASKLGIPKIFTTETGVAYDIEKTKVVKLYSSEKKNSSWVEYLKTPVYGWRLSKKLDQETVLVASLFRSLMVAVWCKIFSVKNLKVVFWIHSDPKVLPVNFLPGLYKAMNKLIYSLTDGFIVNSKNAKGILNHFYGTPESKIEVVYNFFDVNEIQVKSEKALPKAHQEFYTDKTIIAVGRQVKLKGHANLISVFGKVLEQVPEARLVLVGIGTESENLKQLAAEKIPTEKILFTGFESNPFKYIAQAKLMAFTSYYEGFGNVIVESLACGTPVMAGDIDNGPREILAPDTPIEFRTKISEKAAFGWLMPKFNADQTNTEVEEIWANELVVILSKKNHNFKKHLLENRARQFDFQNASEAFLKAVQN